MGSKLEIVILATVTTNVLSALIGNPPLYMSAGMNPPFSPVSVVE